jgi:phosphoserine phosphatase RsbU/P
MDLTSMLERILTRMNSGEESAFVEFADLMGPIFRDYFGNQGLDEEEAERRSVECVHEIGKQVVRGLPPYHAVMGDVLQSKHFEEDLRAAVFLQRSLMTFAGVLPARVRIAFENRPCRVLSGDFCCALSKEGTVLVASGDASGKGLPAALYATVAVTLLKVYVTRRKVVSADDLVDLLWDLHVALLGENMHENYLTLILALLNVPLNRLILASAAGPKPVLCQDGRWTKLPLTGRNLGLSLESAERNFPKDKCFDTVEFPFASGGVVVLYSDGVPDQLGITEEPYGLERLLECLARCNDLQPSSVLRDVLADLDTFQGEAPICDDQTIIVVRVEPEQAEELGHDNAT